MMLSTNKKAQLLIDAQHCDPLLGDTACQIPAIKLVSLTHTDTLNEEQFVQATQYIQQCRILTDISHKIYGEFMSGVTQFTDIKKLDPKLVATEKLSTPTKINTFIAKTRSHVASQGIQFLMDKTGLDFFNDGLEKYLNKEFLYLSSSKIRISILPCFISTKMMLNIIKQDQSLLIVNLHRVVERPKQFLGSENICYRYQDGAFRQPTPTETLALEPATTIDMYSAFETPETARVQSIEPFFLLSEFLPFIDGFKNFDIAKIILMCAAAHAQTPQHAKGHTEEVASDFLPDTLESAINLADVPINLDTCSKEEYRALHHVAKQYDLLNPNLFFYTHKNQSYFHV